MVLEVAIKQTGPPQAKQAAEASQREAGKSGAGVGTLKVHVQEVDAAASAAPHELVVGDEYLAHQEFKLQGKWGGPKRGPRKKKDKQVEEIDEEIEEYANLDLREEDKTPVRWIVLDPSGEWLADTYVAQPLWMWTAQLERATDIRQQLQALYALRAQCEMFPQDKSKVNRVKEVINTIRSVVCNRQAFCRLRAEAAVVLGQLSAPVLSRVGGRGVASQVHNQAFVAGRDFLLRCGPRPSSLIGSMHAHDLVLQHRVISGTSRTAGSILGSPHLRPKRARQRRRGQAPWRT